VLITFIGRRSGYFGWLAREDELGLLGVAAEDFEVFSEIGSTALKTRNCFAASEEFRNVCFKREAAKLGYLLMSGH